MLPSLYCISQFQLRPVALPNGSSFLQLQSEKKKNRVKENMLQRFRDNKTKLDICPSYAHLLHSTAKQVISHRGKNEKVREMRICDVFVSVVVMLGSRKNPFYNTFFIQLYRTKNSHMSVIKFAVGVGDSFQVGQLTGYNPTTDPMFGYCFRDCSLWILLASTSISLAP